MATARKQLLKGRRFDELRAFVVPKAKLVTKSVWNHSFIYNAFRTVGLVLFYYSFSITLTFYNQRFIHAFKFPLSITMVHLVSKFVMAGCVRIVLSWWKGEKRVTLSWRQYIKRLAPPGIASSIDIGLSNWSFEYITVSLYTMTKSTAVVFIMAFSILFKLEKPRCSLVAVVLCIALGLFMFTFESTQFNLLGFLLVLSASFTTGIRWTLSQLILQKSELGEIIALCSLMIAVIKTFAVVQQPIYPWKVRFQMYFLPVSYMATARLTHPIDMMYHIQPWMILTLLPLSAGFEGVRLVTSELTFAYKDGSLLLEHLAILMAGALLAFMLELSEFLLVRLTNSLTLSIAGIIKEVCTLLLAAVINGDKMNALNIFGLLICLMGIAIHVVLRAVYNEESGSTDKAGPEAVELMSPHLDDDDSTEDTVWEHSEGGRKRPSNGATPR